MTPDKCKSCKNRVNDVGEGQVCLAIPARNYGLAWPGQPVITAWRGCEGRAYAPSKFGRFGYWVGL